jgi:hypothetical protein
MHFYNVSIIDSFQCTMFESSNKKMVFVCCSSSERFYINLHLHSIQLSFLFSFLVKVRFVVFFLFFLLVERRVGKFTKVLLTISFTDGSSIECIKGVVAWAWHPYIG